MATKSSTLRKQQLVALIKERTGVSVDPDTMFDVQVKRIHEYKRQLLNVLVRHQRCTTGSGTTATRPVTPRTVIFGGKAAPGYFMAKLIIKLINSVAATIDCRPSGPRSPPRGLHSRFQRQERTSDLPAADLSEQISTAGKEASGTGNMKFSMNGALTIGTLDGANVEIREEVGAENFFLFGLTVEQVMQLKRSRLQSAPLLRQQSRTETSHRPDRIRRVFRRRPAVVPPHRRFTC